MPDLLAHTVDAARGRWRDVLQSLWFVPSAIVAVLIGLAFGVVEIDRALASGGDTFGFEGDPSAARLILSSVAASLITVAGLVLSLTVLTLQLVSSQFTPRALRGFMGDRVTQLTAGLFVGVFAYCMIVLRTVRNEGKTIDPFVPGLGVTLAIALSLIALGVLLFFIHHVASSIQASSLIRRIGSETLSSIDSLFPEPRGVAFEQESEADAAGTGGLRGPVPMYAPRAGYVQRIDVGALANLESGPAHIKLRVSPGDFVTERTRLAEVWLRAGESGVRGERQLPESLPPRGVTISDERDIVQDARYGLRQLVDIALRALSPGINDPSTAVTCLGYLRACLERLTERDLPATKRLLEEPDVVVEAVHLPYRAYLELGFLEIARAARADARVQDELVAALRAVDDIARDGPHPERVADVADLVDRVQRIFAGYQSVAERPVHATDA